MTGTSEEMCHSNLRQAQFPRDYLLVTNNIKKEDLSGAVRPGNCRGLCCLSSALRRQDGTLPGSSSSTIPAPANFSRTRIDNFPRPGKTKSTEHAPGDVSHYSPPRLLCCTSSFLPAYISCTNALNKRDLIRILSCLHFLCLLSL